MVGRYPASGTKTLALPVQHGIVAPMSEQPSPPSLAELTDIALRYLGRYAATEAGVHRVLMRRIDRWLAQTATTSEETRAMLRALVPQVVARLAVAGAIDDRSFAEARGRSLRREGQSRQSARAKLIAKGVPAALARQAVDDDPEVELSALLIAARRRRIGPFAASRAEGSDRDSTKDVARLVRAGFAADLVRRALTMSLEEAEQRIYDARR